MKLFVPFLFAILFASCKFHSGTFHSNGTSANVHARTAGTVRGTSNVFYFLGLGGLRTSTLVHDAKQNIYQRYPIPKGMVLDNVTIDQSRTTILVALIHRVTITADLIEIGNELSNKSYKGFFTTDSIYFPLSNEPYDYLRYSSLPAFTIGDKVSFVINGKSETGTIVAKNVYGYICKYSENQKIYLQKAQMQLVP
jgi:hypothetical protein